MFDSIALPALMVHQNGQLVGIFVRVCEELKPFTEDMVKEFLSLFCSPLAQKGTKAIDGLNTKT
jgi:hypothetical protein